MNYDQQISSTQKRIAAYYAWKESFSEWHRHKTDECAAEEMTKRKEFLALSKNRRKMVYIVGSWSETMIRRHATVEDFTKWESMAESMTDAELFYAAQDCRKVEALWRGHDPIVEGFYSDQAATYGTALYRRRQGKWTNVTGATVPLLLWPILDSVQTQPNDSLPSLQSPHQDAGQLELHLVTALGRWLHQDCDFPQSIYCMAESQCYSPFNGVRRMIYLNETAKNDPAVQIAIESYMLQLRKEEEYRDKVRKGLIQPIHATSWNISDRH